MNQAFFAAIRPLFGGSLTQDQVDGINVIAEMWDRAGDGDPGKLAYLLATAYHETARTMEPIHERGQRSYFDKYEPNTKIGAALGNEKTGDGYLYRGRGFVQLTGRANYRRAGGKVSADLVSTPDLALQPHYAAMILVKGCMEGWFTGKSLEDYIGNGKVDFVGARRVVNGIDKAEMIAGYARTFRAALTAAEAAPKPAPKPIPAETAFPEPLAPKRQGLGWMVWLAILIMIVAAVWIICGAILTPRA